MSRAILKAFACALIMCIAICSGKPAFASDVIFKDQSDVGEELHVPVHNWCDPSRPPKAIVVAIHGLVFHGRAYDILARHLVSQGYDFYAQDLRGFGDWRPVGTAQTPAFASDDREVHYTQSKDDLTSILKVLRRRSPAVPIFCLGESFGANYAIWEASTEPTLVDGAIASGLSFKVFVHPRPLWVPTFFKGLIHPKSPINLAPYLAPTLSNDKEITQACLDDPATSIHLTPTELIKASITNRWALQQVSAIPEGMPILVIAGEKDQIQHTKALREFVPKMGSKNKELVILPNKGHLLLEHRPLDTEVAQIIDKWLSKQVSLKMADDREKQLGEIRLGQSSAP